MYVLKDIYKSMVNVNYVPSIVLNAPLNLIVLPVTQKFIWLLTHNITVNVSLDTILPHGRLVYAVLKLSIIVLPVQIIEPV